MASEIEIVVGPSQPHSAGSVSVPLHSPQISSMASPLHSPAQSSTASPKHTPSQS